MLKWIVTLIVAIFLLGMIGPHLARLIRFGKLPGDFVIRFRGRTYTFPVSSTIILSVLLWLLSRIV